MTSFHDISLPGWIQAGLQSPGTADAAADPFAAAEQLIFDQRDSDLGDPVEILRFIGAAPAEITEEHPDFDDVYSRAQALPGFRADLARAVMDGSLQGPVIVWSRR